MNAGNGPDGASVRRVLVTGAAGMIGRAVLARLATAGVEVTALVLDDPGDLPARRVVVGNAGDPIAVREALDGVDAVAHLAALPSPMHGTPLEVFAGNTQATFVVLCEAAEVGVRRAMIASSYAILGLPFSPRVLHPACYPIDEDLPLQIEDPYALSKFVDEATALQVVRRYGATVVALRFPFVGGDERLAEQVRATTADSHVQARNSWAYLHTADAAEATWRALTVPASGFHRVFVAAPRTVSPYPTAQLVATHHPGAQLRRPLVGNEVPIDLSAARLLLGDWPHRLVFAPATPEAS